jgi:hypothetical protein
MDEVPWSIPVATSPARKSARPVRNPAKFPAWLEHRFGTIRDLPEDEPDAKENLRRNLVGYGGSALGHLLIVLLLSIFVFLIPRDEGPVTIDTSLGTPFGSEDGLEPVGGFDEELMSDVEPVELDASTLLQPVEPVPELNTESLFARPDESSNNSTGIGGGAEFGVARFGAGGTEKIQGINVKVGDPQFTLVWDSQADIDLHVLEPGGAHIFWEDRHGRFGGELDVDDVDGFGPENIYWVVDRTDQGKVVKGRGPAGRYQWFVHFYGGHGGFNSPTQWKVRVKQAGTVTIFEGTLRRVGERSRTFSLDIAPSPDRPTKESTEGKFPDFDEPVNP